MAPVTLQARVERKHPQLPRFLVVPSKQVAGWRLGQTTTTVDVTLDGSAIGRRSLKYWDSDRWFVELPADICRRLGLELGTRVSVELQLVSTALPAELQRLLEVSARAAAVWGRLSAGQQRMVREHVAGAKAPATRTRRATRALGVLEGTE
jgi:hypothetical protein